MTDDEKEERKLERLTESHRVFAASLAACCAAVLALIVLCNLLPPEGQGRVAVLQPLLALTLSVFLILGARAVEGPIRLAGRRREVSSASAGAGALVLWLGCFCVIQAAILVADVASRWTPRQDPCSGGEKGRVYGTLTVGDGTDRRRIAITGCEIGKPIAGATVPTVQNGQAPADVDAANAGDIG